LQVIGFNLKKNIKNKFTILLLLIATQCFAGNPYLKGKWKGLLISKNADADNKNGLPVTLFILDDNDVGNFSGDMILKYRYQSDVYKAKYNITGRLDYNTFKLTIQQNKIIYSDILPKGLNWCIGNGTARMYRSTYKKSIIIDGYFTTNCGAERMRLVLVKM
jgi:hypothetical protein